MRAGQLWLCIWLVLAGTSSSAELSLAGKVVAVQDGDTITVLDVDLKQHRVRLSGIDAPEKGQAFGHVSQVHLASLCFERIVTARCPKVDQYGREVCTVWIDGRDVSLSQIRAGLAWHYKRFANEQPAHEREAYSIAEDRARMAGLGLWQDQNPTPPWEWRQQRRGAVTREAAEPRSGLQ